MKKRILLILIVCLIFIGGLIWFSQKKDDKKLKYIFLFIGDGMSSAQVELTEIYENHLQNKLPLTQNVLSFTNFPIVGLRKNYSYSDYIPDSASSASALASGTFVSNGKLNISPDGSKIKPITYALKDNGFKIGIVTTVSLNHATPAAFYAMNDSRDNYDAIAYSLVDSNFDYFAGGDFNVKNSNVLDIKNYATTKGYKIIDSEEKLENINSSDKNIVVSPYASSGGSIPLAFDSKSNFNLANYVSKGINVLENENGFFMMVESGMIDSAAHLNDARSMIEEVKELDSAVTVAMDFAYEHPGETLIIVTGDHETGGLTLGNNAIKYYFNMQNLNNQKYSFSKTYEYVWKIKNQNISYEELAILINEDYGINIEDNTDALKKAYGETVLGNDEILKETIFKIINDSSGISFSSTHHTADRVPVYVYGYGSEKFSGVYDTVELNNRLKNLLGIK